MDVFVMMGVRVHGRERVLGLRPEYRLDIELE